MKVWTRARKGEMYAELQKAEQEGRLEAAVRDVARRYGRPEEEVLRVYLRLKRRLAAQTVATAPAYAEPYATLVAKER